MLVFILTDLKASAAVLATLLKKSVSESFNLLTVDNCGSTNDSVFLLASGVGQKNFLKNGTADYRKFQAALTGLCRDLCRQLAADGEGATKLIEVQVKNVFSREAARILAKAVAGSALVKAAVFGADPNWGRILAALGSTRIKFAPGRIEVFLGPNRVVSSGRGIDFNRKRLKTYLSGKIVRIIIDCHQGNNSAVAFGCDLSYDYVRINAEYN
jgi:glutamate N-acetyltransferase/amino-acid N-acetyltransferase